MARRRRSRGFFIIWGSRNRISTEPVAPVQTVCPSCRQQATLVGKVCRNWFTLYFIPVFPTGTGTRFTECLQCHAQFRGTIDEFRQLVVRHSQSIQDAIALFNEMRETPADSEKLLRLMRLYIELGEPGEAISAATTYSNALHASDQCLTLLGRLYYDARRMEDSLRCFTAALAINPLNAEAQKCQDALLQTSGSAAGGAPQ